MEYHQLKILLNVEFHRDQYLILCYSFIYDNCVFCLQIFNIFADDTNLFQVVKKLTL